MTVVKLDGIGGGTGGTQAHKHTPLQTEPEEQGRRKACISATLFPFLHQLKLDLKQAK